MPPPIESAEYESVKDLFEGISIVGDALEILEFIYDFGKTDPIENAIDRIEQEIGRIKSQLEALNQRLDSVTQRIVKVENQARIRELREHVTRLSTLAFAIRNNPGDRDRAAEAAFEAGARADTFLTDEDLWKWSDVRIVTPRDAFGQPTGPARFEPVGPDFKTELALPVYSMALVTWITGVLVHTAGDREEVRERYGEQLDRHITAVSTRFDWRDDGTPPVTIAEQIRSRIWCEPVAVSKFAQDGVCTFTVQCENTIRRTRVVIREFSVPVENGGPTHLCTINPEVVTLDEQDQEEQDTGIRLLARWDEMLRSVVASGHLPADQFIGQFPSWTAAIVNMYGVDSTFNMDYFVQMLPSSDGTWLEGPLRVGTGWNFDAIVPGGSSAVLAKRTTGEWLWYRHRGSEAIPATDRWSGPHEIGRWSAGEPGQTFWTHFGSGFGVVYGTVLVDFSGQFTQGDLYWNRFEGYLGGTGTFATPQRIGNGWDGLSRVCSAGEGVIYGVRSTGVLRWYHHSGWATGENTWDEPRDLVNSVNWSTYERLIPAGDGVLYGVLPNGLMHCYRHFDWKTGGDRIEGPLVVDRNWRFYRPAFAALPGALEGIF